MVIILRMEVSLFKDPKTINETRNRQRQKEAKNKVDYGGLRPKRNTGKSGMELKTKPALFPRRVPLDADVPECAVSHLCGSNCPDWHHDKL